MSRPRAFNTRYAISASVQVADLDGDGADEFIVASRRVWSLAAGGRARARLVGQGSRPVASTPALFRPDGERRLVVGCDDGWIYTTAGAGAGRLSGLVHTGLDVYSSPVAFQAPGGAGGPRLAFGSDDGGIWCVDAGGVPRPGFPVKCAAFVSATPAVCDFDGDGRPEVLVGDWAGRFHAVRQDGTELEGYPVDLGWPIWSSAAVADIDGDGRLEAVVATRNLHALRAGGGAVAGFPRRLGTYAVGSPIVVDLLGDGAAAVLVGCDKLYAVDGAGRDLPGFPKDLAGYLWASPIAVDKAEGGPLAVFVGSWDGNLHEVGPGGAASVAIATDGPIFGAAGACGSAGGGATLAVGSWDGRVRFVLRPDLRVGPRAWPTFHRTPSNERLAPQAFTAPSGAARAPDGPVDGAPPAVQGHTTRPKPAQHRRATFIDFDGAGLDNLARAQLVYQVAGEERTHPSPAVAAGGRLTALVQPLGVGRLIRFHLEGSTFGGAPVRYPASGEASFVIQQIWGLRLGGLLAKLEARR